MSISLYDGGATTVMILPLVAMHEEYKCRAKRYGLACQTWTIDCDITTAPQLLLVAVENCSWPALRDHVSTLIRLGRLARIVVDEAHLLAKHESFRPCMGMLAFFGTLAISIVLMTATCPYDLETYLFQKLGRKIYQVLRRSTDRPEISQKMIPIQADPSEFEQTVANNIISTITPSNEAERALLFCNSRDECDRMARLLGWRPYHSSVSVEERSEGKKSWIDGVVLGLACSSMLNCCLDYPSVSYVFHLGPPRDVVDYYQAIGRATRAGGVGECIVYFNPSSLERPAQVIGSDLFGKQVIYDMLQDKLLCRRLRPGFFLDGVSVPCAMLPGAQLCDICLAQLNCQRPDPGLRRIPHDLLVAPASIQPRGPNDMQTQLALLPDPLNQPASSASFATHFAAANSCLDIGKAKINCSRELGSIIRTACDNLTKSCVACWSSCLEYSHPLDECRWASTQLRSEMWRKWDLSFRLPVGCCFLCGCPQKVRFSCVCDYVLRYSPNPRWFIYRLLAKNFVSMNMPVTRAATGSLYLNLLRFLSSKAQL